MGKAFKTLSANKLVTIYQAYKITEGLIKIKEGLLTDSEQEVFSIL